MTSRKETRPLIVLLHGRGAGPENILDLVPRLARPAFDYVAPAAPHRTWYPYSFLAPIEQNEPHLSNALAQIGEVIASAESRGVPRDRIVLMGFSQGACLATEFAIRHASRFGGLVAFSGGAIGPPGTQWAAEGTDDTRAAEGGDNARPAESTDTTRATEGSERQGFAGMPAFFGCSDIDAHVPAIRVRESAAVCERLGARVTTRIYPGMGHLINDDEIAHAQALLDAVAGH